MNLYFGIDGEIEIVLEDSAHVPVTGLAYDATGLEFYLAKPGDEFLLPVEIPEADWREVGRGHYGYMVPGEYLDVLGVLQYRCEYPGAVPYAGARDIVQSLTGFGDTAKTYTSRDENGDPRAGILVWMSADIGAPVVGPQISNIAGQTYWWGNSGSSVYIYQLDPSGLLQFTNPDLEEF